MTWMSLTLAAALAGAGPLENPGLATAPQGTTSTATAPAEAAPVRLAQYVDTGEVVDSGGPMLAPQPVWDPRALSGAAGQVFQEARRPFESDHAFDDFTGPITDAIQAKDPRSVTEARLLFLQNWGRPNMPVLGAGSVQVYALQLRLALTERLSLIADKDGIVRLSPKGSKSVTGLANIAVGAKYVLYRDVENQTLFTGVVQYEAPTGYANIFQNQGSGLLAVYGVFGKEFGNDNHFLATFGQNIAMQNQSTGYWYTGLHVDKKIGSFYPLLEANWFYYNQPGHYLPPLGIEGDGLLNLGTSNFNGRNLVTLAPGLKYQPNANFSLGAAYEFPVSDWQGLLGNRLIVEAILRY